MSANTFPRRTFLKGSGALIVSFSFLGRWPRSFGQSADWRRRSTAGHFARFLDRSCPRRQRNCIYKQGRTGNGRADGARANCRRRTRRAVLTRKN